MTKEIMGDINFYVKELRSDECQCGRYKAPGRSFCYKCYTSLPRDMRRDLWQGIGDGYEEAHDAAVHYLNS